MAQMGPYRFHAYERSYFSAKVRPALRFKRLWYEEKRADVREVIELSGLHFVPILETPEGEVWQDTSEILDALEAHHPEPSLLPETPLQRLVAYLIELYADEFGLLPAMHYRWGTPEGEADGRAAFRAMIGDPQQAQRAGDMMARARVALGATEATGPAIEAHTRALLDALSAHFACEPYLLGKHLSLADCALMGPLYAHLYNDAVSRPLMIGTALPVVEWIERCNYPGDEARGAWPANDTLPPTLHAVLEVMGRDAVPLLLACQRDFASWLESATLADGKLPPTIGPTKCDLRGRAFQQANRPYTAWMLQRVLDVYTGLPEGVRGAAREKLSRSSFSEVLALQPNYRLAKRDRRLVVDASLG